ncbi:hypothetical protein EHI8A_004100 [Entamoeba histolytica HM-1:IMSS-B]|uniref:Uncharacterized protein n=6 Tax=Entamoeba histolytica TaxID=5759 RepID=C4M1B0_ENTH1|nr:hypothetical protein EHI_169870 [Entamoeba histolytica HM-1:IMSS]EMD43664.1 Hypothetical protein EHI5A_016850 [Entamoeba histolytica KU27]EMH75528.1 hypothetical protein EHI8A_004100 [Entamoeba histolytica HM-1:IMSS-B]EMS16646.1 hypothetical protein KM1_017250 [Entamoeba histolytica HM-3:IMSS]ENY63505.1 hypothetical protein EHI7A_005840 [Entamoeba histolytica HM-1:IMSS-A]GAT94986.1 hypothetical protein CL6EHI_169870 [Entamoeba histolytica]|eukprot:XP_656004.1 hypothetical protein EHI_169870 [Entamoeba histolytica HM-1:IMSS]
MEKQKTSLSTPEQKKNLINANRRIERRGCQEMILLSMITCFGYKVQFVRPKHGCKALPYVQVQSIKRNNDVLFENDEEFEKKCIDKNGKRDKEIYTSLSMEVFIGIGNKLGIQTKGTLRKPKQVRPKFTKVTEILCSTISIRDKQIFSIGHEILEGIVSCLRQSDCNTVFGLDEFLSLVQPKWEEESKHFMKELKMLSDNPIKTNEIQPSLFKTKEIKLPTINYLKEEEVMGFDDPKMEDCPTSYETPFQPDLFHRYQSMVSRSISEAFILKNTQNSIPTKEIPEINNDTLDSLTVTDPLPC